MPACHAGRRLFTIFKNPEVTRARRSVYSSSRHTIPLAHARRCLGSGLSAFVECQLGIAVMLLENDQEERYSRYSVFLWLICLKLSGSIENMERETGLEPATSSLGSWHSTTELLPPVCCCSHERSV